MPKADDSVPSINDAYLQSKHLRLNRTNKSLRHLRAFERINYKKTCEVKKTAHGIVDEHQINDGNLRCTIRPMTYSLNKKKRWLLPEIIEERIRQFDRNEVNAQNPSLDEKLKIEMFQNENVQLKSTCFRYANSQATPQVIHKNGRCFNGISLSRWINFETRHDRRRRRRGLTQPRHDENQPNFGINNRPGFFPSEVKYEFLYPRRAEVGGKSKIFYRNDDTTDHWEERHRKDTNKNRRSIKRRQCYVDINDYEDELDENEYEEESDDFPVDRSNKYLLEYFILLNTDEEEEEEEEIRPVQIEETMCDRKSRKFFEEPIKPTRSTTNEKIQSTETLLCSLPCSDQSEFVLQMQNSTAQISQANVSPAMFIQRTDKSLFSTLYSFSPRSSSIDITVKFTDSSPNLLFPSTDQSLISIIDLIATKLNEYQRETEKPMKKPFHPSDVDALRGSLPLPSSLTKTMLLVQPNSTNKQTAIRLEHLDDDNRSKFSIEKSSSADQCSICCDDLSADEIYRILPCQHCLCHQCLISFIQTNISTNATLTCFQTNCSTKINSAVIQAFVSFDVYQIYHQNNLDRQLFSSGSYRKCPSRICSNLIIVDDSKKPSLMCSCGQRVCSTCLDEYHFPASCEQYKFYHRRLRDSGDDLLSVSLLGDRNDCYIAEGKNCPACGEFVEKNGGCPHMTCKCGYEFCWACLHRWETHLSQLCTTVPESQHELRSSVRNRLHNKAINRRRERNFYSYSLLSGVLRRSKIDLHHHDLFLATYIDLNTMAEFLYVLLQRRKLESNIRAVLTRTARQLEIDASTLKTALLDNRPDFQYIEILRQKLTTTLTNLIHMKSRGLFFDKVSISKGK